MFSMFLWSCKEDDRFHEKMYFTNSSNSPIYVEWSSSEQQYLLSKRAKHNWYNYIKSNGSSVFYNFDTWESFFLHSSDTLRIYVADAEKVMADDTTNLLVHYKLTLGDLEDLNWHLSYPPTLRMKDIHMTPSIDSIIGPNF